VTSAGAKPAAVFSTLIANNQLVIVWSFDNATKTWHLYDPLDAVGSDITVLKSAASYWIKVSADVTLNYGTSSSALYTGWNTWHL
jgi:hypothetical protein